MKFLFWSETLCRNGSLLIICTVCGLRGCRRFRNACCLRDKTQGQKSHIKLKKHCHKWWEMMINWWNHATVCTCFYPLNLVYVVLWWCLVLCSSYQTLFFQWRTKSWSSSLYSGCVWCHLFSMLAEGIRPAHDIVRGSFLACHHCPSDWSTTSSRSPLLNAIPASGQGMEGSWWGQ